MPWLQTDRMNERIQFVLTHKMGLYTKTELCERFGVSRKTGDKWLKRHADEGLQGLEDRSHAPRRCPHKISTEVARALIELRRRKPGWGPKTLLARLEIERPDLTLPAPSTVGDLLKREELVRPRRRRARPAVSTGGPVRTRHPNETWSADYKGQFRTRDGRHCYPLTIQDAHTRFLLRCEAHLSVRTEEARPCFEAAFHEYGLPESIRTDNGPPFAASTPLRLTRLNVWWIKLGITPDRSRLGCPQDNGRHERMHRDMNPLCFPPAEGQDDQQLRFDAFREERNHIRPHHALEMKTPASLYVPSPRPMPPSIPAPEYPLQYETRSVRTVGTFRFRGREIFLSEVLAGDTIALEQVDDGVWSIFFHHVLLARYDERTGVWYP